MINLIKESQTAARTLFDEKELDELYRLLGYQIDLLETHPEETTAFAPRMIRAGEAEAGVDWETIGKRIFHRWNVSVYKLICGSDEENKEIRDEITDLFTNKYTLIGGLAVLLTTQFGVAPAVATLIATIAIKRFFDPALEEVCVVWKASLPETVWDEEIIPRD